MLDRVVGEKADVRFSVPKMSLDIRDLDKAVIREGSFCCALHCIAQCYRCQGYGHVSRGCIRPGRNEACWRCGDTKHRAKKCKAPPRCLTCTDRDEKNIAHVSGSGSCPVFWGELQRLKSEKESFCSSTSGGEGSSRSPYTDGQEKRDRCHAHK